MSKIKERLKLTKNVFKVAWKSSKAYVIVVFLRRLFKSLLTYSIILASLLIINALTSGADKNHIIRIAIIIVSIQGVLGVFITLFDYLVEKYNLYLDDGLQWLLSKKCMELDYSLIETQKTMNLIREAEDGSNSNGGVAAFVNILADTLLDHVLSIVYSVTLLITLFKRVDLVNPSKFKMFLNSPFVLIIILTLVLISTIFSLWVGKKSNEIQYDVYKKNVDGNRRYGYLYGLCSGYEFGKDIRIYSMQKMINENMEENKSLINALIFGAIKAMSKYEAYLIFFNTLIVFSSYSLIGLKAMYGLLSIGAVVSSVASIALINSALNNLTTSINQFNIMLAYLNNYFMLLELKTDITYGEEEIDSSQSIEIEFKNVSFKYPNTEENSLKNISFKINSNSRVALVGPNGAGKTTLIKLICRFYEVDDGEILINGKNIKCYKKESLMKNMGVVFQDFKLLSETIKNNILMGVEEMNVKPVLEKAGILERILRMKDQENTIIYQNTSEDGVEISGGEAQKIAIARALYKDAPLVILDEPTAALDPKSEAEIYEKLDELMGEKTSIFISHRMSSCIFCQHIIVVDNGKIIEEGTHEELLNNKDLYFKMWSAQANYYQNNN